MTTIAVVGLFVGWGLAMTSLSDWRAGGLAVVLGLVFVFVRIGRLGVRLLALCWGLIQLGWSSFLWLRGGATPVIAAPAISAMVELGQDVFGLFTRVYNWLLTLNTDDFVFDPVVSALRWGLKLSITKWSRCVFG